MVWGVQNGIAHYAFHIYNAQSGGTRPTAKGWPENGRQQLNMADFEFVRVLWTTSMADWISRPMWHIISFLSFNFLSSNVLLLAPFTNYLIGCIFLFSRMRSSYCQTNIVPSLLFVYCCSCQTCQRPGMGSLSRGWACSVSQLQTKQYWYPALWLTAPYHRSQPSISYQ